MVKTNHNKTQLIYTDQSNHLELAQAPYKLSFSLPPLPKIGKFYFKSRFKSIKLILSLRKKYIRLFQCALLKLFQWYYSSLS